ncbi:MAG: hypothetical protein ACFB4I_22890 [Cyanophyceae cyanobacterium]
MDVELQILAPVIFRRRTAENNWRINICRETLRRPLLPEPKN